MRGYVWKGAAFIFVFIMLVQAYIGIVQMVGAFRPDAMSKRIELKSARNLFDSNTFSTGDNLRIVVKSDIATVYAVRIFNASSVMYEGKGQFHDSLAEEDVELCSRVFSPGSYTVTFSAFSCNIPIAGVQFSDTQNAMFLVSGIGTKLSVNATFDCSLGSLEMCANLTDNDGYPVSEETIEFGNRLANKTKLTDGWIPLGSAETGSDGIALLRVAFGMPSANYSIRAKHEESPNFGESSAVVTVEANVNWTVDNPCQSPKRLSAFLAGSTLENGPMNWNLTCTNSTPCANMQTCLAASCTSAFNLTGEMCFLLFFHDYMNISGFFRGVEAGRSFTDSATTYNATCRWEPKFTGVHEFIVGIYNGSSDGVINDGRCGRGIFSFAEITLDFQACPTSLILQCSSAMKDGVVPTLPVTAGFFGPNPYAVEPGSFYSSTIIAPMVAYDGLNYTFDKPVSADLRLYSNSSFQGNSSTAETGLFTFPLTCAFSGSYSTLNLTVVTDTGNSLYANKSVTGIFNFTRISIHDAATSGNDFSFNYTVYNCNQKTDTIYMGGEPNTIKATASLFSLPLQNATVTFPTAKRMSCETVDNVRWPFVTIVTVPTGADLLRVVNIFISGGLKPYQKIKAHFGNNQSLWLDGQNLTSIPENPGTVALLVNPPVSDIHKDGSVNILDAIMLSSAYGSCPGKPTWKSDADLNSDNVINILDAIILSNHYGDTNDTAYLDRGTIEFLTTQPDAHAETDNSGVSSLNWLPSEAGTYLVRANLPSDFNVTVNFHSGVTEVNACLSTIGYVTVVKRSVCLTVVSPSQPCTQAMNADADAYISQFADENHGQDSVLQVGKEHIGGQDYESRTLVHFNVSAVPANAYVVSARLNLFDDCVFTLGYSGSVGVFTVLESWSEYDVHWSTCPSYDSTPSWSPVSALETNKWVSWDVTENVRHWLSSPSENFGLLLIALNDGSKFMLTSNSREASSNRPGLEVTYITSSTDLVIGACDNVTQKPVDNLNLSGYFEFDVGPWPFSGQTNESGYYSNMLSIPDTSALSSVTVSSSETSVYQAGYASAVFDFRFPTNITYSFGNPREVTPNFEYAYDFSVASSGLFGLNDVPARFCINGTSINGAIYNNQTDGTASSDGSVTLRWTAPSSGTYMINVTFDGSELNAPWQTLVTVSASAKALAVLFSVSPQEFVVGSQVMLNATVIDVSTNQVFTETQVQVQFFRCSEGINTNLGIPVSTNQYGWVTKSDTYPGGSSAYAYGAVIVPTMGQILQGIAGNTVQLTVARSSDLLLDVGRDWVSGNHTVQGWLLSAGSAVPQRLVKIGVNDTQYSSVTNGSGYFSLSLSLLPVNNNATLYTIAASFEDIETQPLTATAWAYTLDGQQYPACTTTQCGYKPAYNTTTLTISAQSTEVMTTMSPEDAQKEAEESGALTIWHEWSWAYPWYRLHVKVHVNPTIHVGFNPILPGGEIAEWNDLNFFSGLGKEALQTVGIEAFGLVATYLSAKYLSIGSFAAGILTELVKIGFQVGFLFPGWNSAEDMLASAVMSAFMLLFAITNFASTVSNFLVRIIDELAWLCKGAVSALTWVLAKLKDMFLWGRGAYSAVVDVMEVVADATLLVLALRRSNELLHGV